jgi:MarR family transcriptional regulator, organic hydroperoxide resistance regulator
MAVTVRQCETSFVKKLIHGMIGADHMSKDPLSKDPSRLGNPRLLTVSRPELLVEGSDRGFRALVHGLLAFSVRLEAIRAGFGSLIGLTGVQYTILISIRHLEADGNVSVIRVARHLRLSGAFVTIEIGKMIKLGLLAKKTDTKDRRRVCLHVTRRGVALLSKLAPTQRRVNDVLFGGLTASTVPVLRTAVDRLAADGDRALALLDYLARHENGLADVAPATKI